MEFTGWTSFDVQHNLRTADLASMGVGRSQGRHLGEILQVMGAAAGLPQGQIAGDQDGARLQEGFLWETIVEYMLAGLSFDAAANLAFKRYMLSLREGILTQVRLEHEGVHMTPDAIDARQVPVVLESYKATRKSLKKALGREDFEQNFIRWMWQEKGYLKGLQAAAYPGINTVRWYVLWAAGDYSRGIGSGPQFMTATAIFEPEEIEDNWRTIKVYEATMPPKEGVSEQ